MRTVVLGWGEVLSSVAVSAKPEKAGRAVGASALRRYAGVWALWGLAVSAVIPGEFSGWNYGLIEGGFGGLLIATLLVTVMYLCLCYSLGELSSAMPFTGGGYAFGRTAFGPLGGYLVGLAQNIEFILTAAAVVVSAGHALDVFVSGLFGLKLPDVIYWAFAYSVFVLINIYGIELTFKIAVLLSVVTLIILGAFAIVAVPNFDISYALEISLSDAGTRWLPNGLPGIARSIPFAIWFLVLVEMLTLAPEETRNPERTVPRGLIAGVWTLIVAAFVVLTLNSAIPPGAIGIGMSQEPFMVGFGAILGKLGNPSILAFMALLGYTAGFHATIYAYGRSIYSLARAGYFPKWLGATHPTRNTPHVALIVGGLIGLGAASLIKLFPSRLHIDAVLLNMSVFAAIISYILQMLAYLSLSRSMPHMKRPYKSPLGATGAMTALMVALAAGAMMFHNPSYRPGLYGCVVVYVLGVAYYAFYGRHKIVMAPEEEFAMRVRKEGAHD